MYLAEKDLGKFVSASLVRNIKDVLSKQFRPNFKYSLSIHEVFIKCTHTRSKKYIMFDNYSIKDYSITLTKMVKFNFLCDIV